jgi:hypothetical protein
MPLIRQPKNFFSGLLFMGFGVAALVISRTYNIGTAAKMGPGYFPRALGILMIVLGGLLSALSFRSAQEPKITWRLRPLAIILVSVCAMPWLTDYLGIVLTSIVMVFIASIASDEFRWKEALISGVILAVASTGIFVYGLAIPLPVWPPFIAGGPS